MLAQARKKFRVRGPDRAANRSGGWFWVRACDAGATCDKDELSLSHGLPPWLGLGPVGSWRFPSVRCGFGVTLIR